MPSGMIYYLIVSLLIAIQFVETVRSTYPNTIERYPTQNVTVTAGKQAILPCHVKATANEERLIVWMNPKKIIISDRESRFMDDPRISVERPFVGDYNLHIRQVRYDDRGEYTCTSNSYPVVTKRIRLIVLVPSKFVNDGQSDQVLAIEGSTVRLSCNATGIPTPNITWFRRIKEDTEEQKEQVGNSGEVLLIHNISRHCGGIYECMAFNGVEPAISKAINVEVQFKPEINIRTKRIGQKRNKETMLECLVTASPQGDNYWKRGNLEISSNEYGHYRVEIYPEKEFAEFTISISLRILNVQEKDFGIYTCHARNVLGEANDFMELYELQDPTLPPPTTTLATTSRFKTYYKTYKNDVYNEFDRRGNDHTRRPHQVSGQIGTGELGRNGSKKQIQLSFSVMFLFFLLTKII